MKKSSFNTYLIATIVSLGGFLFGFDASIISAASKFINYEFALTDLQFGWMVSAPTFSAMFAMLAAGPISDRIGRKKVLLIVAFFYLVSAVIAANAGNFTWLIVARMLGGVAIGSSLVLAPVYIAEFAPAESRGKLVSIQQLNIVLGFLLAHYCNYLLQNELATGNGFLTNENVWRWMFGAELFPALLYLGALFFVPRSPRWLFVKGEKTEATAVLTKLYGAAFAAKESESIAANLAGAQRQEKATLKSLFHKKLKYVLLVGLVLGVLQQITGVNAIFFYVNSIFEQAGNDTSTAALYAVWLGFVNLIFAFISIALIDKMGRRPLLLIGMAGMALTMALISYGFSQATYQLSAEQTVKIDELDTEPLAHLHGQVFHDDVTFKNALKEALGEAAYSKHERAIIQASVQMNPIYVLIGVLGFIAAFALSIGPVMWVMLSELFPNYIRGLAISAIGFLNSAINWTVQLVFPWELTNLGNATTFLIYAVFGTVGFFIMLKILPETKGKTLEEIEREYVGG